MKTKFGKKFACIDIGTSKICSSIAYIKNKEIRIVDFQNSKSEGINRGIIQNFELFANSIAESVEKLEKKSGESIKSAFINIASKELNYCIRESSILLPKKPIQNKEISKLISLINLSEFKGQKILHVIPLSYSLDKISGIKNPVGMVGTRLTMRAIIIYIPESIFRNILFAFEKSHIKISGVVASPLAAGLGALTNEELNNGTILIDLGASLTTVSIFFDGSLEEFKVFPFGSINITKDISYALDIPFQDAERIKTLYGRAFRSIIDEKEFVLVPKESDNLINLKQVSKSEIIKAIEPRINEMLEMINEYIKSFRYSNVVIAGATSSMSGLIDLAKRVFKKQVKSANINLQKYPSHIAIGLMNFVNIYDQNNASYSDNKYLNDNIFSNFLKWVNENF